MTPVVPAPPEALTVEASRRVGASPAGLALLLAAPRAADLWPTASRTPAQDGGVELQLLLPPAALGRPGATPAPVRLSLRARPPRRDEAGGFVLDLLLADAVAGDEEPCVTGRLDLRPSGPAGRGGATLAVLDLRLPPGAAAEAVAPLVQACADRFLAALGERAERRADAA